MTDDIGLKIVLYSLHGAHSVLGVGHWVVSKVQDTRRFPMAPPSGAELAECGLWAAFLVLLGCWLWLVAPYCNTRVVAPLGWSPGVSGNSRGSGRRSRRGGHLWKEGKEQQEEL